MTSWQRRGPVTLETVADSRLPNGPAVTTTSRWTPVRGSVFWYRRPAVVAVAAGDSLARAVFRPSEPGAMSTAARPALASTPATAATSMARNPAPAGVDQRACPATPPDRPPGALAWPHLAGRPRCWPGRALPGRAVLAGLARPHHPLLGRTGREVGHRVAWHEPWSWLHHLG